MREPVGEMAKRYRRNWGANAWSAANALAEDLFDYDSKGYQYWRDVANEVKRLARETK